MSTKLSLRMFVSDNGGSIIVSIRNGILHASWNGYPPAPVVLISTNIFPPGQTATLTFTTTDGRSCTTVERPLAEERVFWDWTVRNGASLSPEPERNPPIELLNGKTVDGFFIDEADGPLPPAPAPRKPGCPECYDTGYRHGFGAPCSRGCRP